MWSVFTKHKLTYNTLRVAYNNVFRKLLGFNYRDSVSAIFVSNYAIAIFDIRIRKACFNFRQRLLLSTNSYYVHKYKYLGVQHLYVA